ncbi:30S ribosomal protein S17 [Candidatus Sumerlaeota bacterium]|nr:30S ribosomal protein S17 [Candidatus Sumerlaeota bacterium]
MEDKVKRRYKTKIGRVISNKMKETVVVAVERLMLHPVYKKRVRRTKKIYAHDKENKCQIGDVVKVTESRPISRLKRWRVSSILERAK